MPDAPAKKKSNATTIIIIVVIAVVVLGVGGTLIAKWVARRAADKIAGGILGATTGSNVSVNSDTGAVSVSNDEGSAQIGNAKWPTDMPSDVPELKGGKITVSTTDKTNKSWSVAASDINQAEYDAYKTSVVAADWISTSTTSFGATIDQYEKDNYNLSLVFDSSSSSLSISVIPKS